MNAVNQRLGSRSVARLVATIGAAFVLAAQAQPEVVTPEAQQLLKASTDFLGKQQRFSLDTRNSFEAVLKSGQKVQFDHTARQWVQRPNKLRADRSGLVEQSFRFDGKTLTLVDPLNMAYARVAAPGTIDEMLDMARTRLDIIAPAADLIVSNAYDVLMQGVTSGFVVGKGVVEGVRCDHLAFRAPHVDWQLWIQEGAQPLPRKIVITTRDVAGAPQFTVVVTKWDLKSAVGSRHFQFEPAAGMKKIEFPQR